MNARREHSTESFLRHEKVEKKIDFSKDRGWLVDNSWQTTMHLLKVFISRLIDDSDRWRGVCVADHFYPHLEKKN